MGAPTVTSPPDASRDHETANHPEYEDIPRCANCDDSHTANHKNCPRYVEHLEKILRVSGKNPNRTKTFNSNFTKPNITYSNITQPNNTQTLTQLTQKTIPQTTTQQLNQNTLNTPLTPPTNYSNQTSFDDFKNLLTELNDLNKICNLKELLNLVGELKNKLKTATSPLEKLIILNDLSEKYII